MIVRDGTAGDARFDHIEVTTYASGMRLIIVVNDGAMNVARLVLTPLQIADGDAWALLARYCLPVVVSIGETTGDSEDASDAD